jgi:Tn3 transposase DDE domain
LLPRIALPELRLAIHARTGFAQALSHISDGTARVADVPPSLCAVLLAAACPSGLAPVIRTAMPALPRGRLSWSQHNSLRAEPLTRANARLGAAQATMA